jgi:hypothetical protein
VAQTRPFALYADLETNWAVDVLKSMVDLDDVHVLFVLRTCWKCKRECLSFHGAANNYQVDVTPWLYWPDTLDSVDQARTRFHLDPFGCVKPRFSKTVGHEYVSQGCSFCDALIGENPLQEQFREISRRMDLRNVPWQFRLDWPPRSLLKLLT